MENSNAQLLSYDEFEKDWIRRHKGSLVQKPKVSSLGLIAGIAIWGLSALGAALVSGAHSIPAILDTIPPVVPSPFKEILSLFGFTIFELLIFSGAVYRRDSRYALAALWTAMIGALAANIGSSIRTALIVGDALALIVAVVLAAIAPLAAFLAGEMVHRLFEKHKEQIGEATAVWNDWRKGLDATINREYRKYENQFKTQNKARHETSSLNSLNEQLPLREYSVNSANGYTKQMNSRRIIQKFFEQHPGFENMTLDNLNKAIEQETGIRVGRTSIHNVRKEWLEQISENGRDAVQ